MGNKKVVKKYEKQGIKHIFRPCAGEPYSKIEEWAVTVFFFIIEISGNKKEQGQMKQINKCSGEIAGVAQNNSGDAQSLHNVPIQGAGFCRLIHSRNSFPYHFLGSILSGSEQSFNKIKWNQS